VGGRDVACCSIHATAAASTGAGNSDDGAGGSRCAGAIQVIKLGVTELAATYKAVPCNNYV
jgi:hypothetical protein